MQPNLPDPYGDGRKLTPSERRFWAKVSFLEGDDACWPWLGAKDKDGRGLFRLKGILSIAPRVAFLFTHYKWPVHLACHTCDNPACVRPSHLYDGTHEQNMQDRTDRGRTTTRRGEASNLARLHEPQVLDIYTRTHEPPSVVAKEFGIATSTVRAIWAGTIWKHLYHAHSPAARVRTRDEHELHGSTDVFGTDAHDAPFPARQSRPS